MVGGKAVPEERTFTLGIAQRRVTLSGRASGSSRESW